MTVQNRERLRLTPEGLKTITMIVDNGDLSISQGILKINHVVIFSTIYNKTETATQITNAVASKLKIQIWQIMY